MLQLSLSNLDAVIFDLDGLILDSERPIRQAVIETAAELGFAIPDDFYAGLIGLPGPECDVIIRRYFGDRFPFDTFNAASGARIAAALTGGIALKAGVRELIADLGRRSMPLAIATSSGRDYVERQLRAAELTVFFTTVATRNDVERGKPHPDLFLKVAADLKVAPERCLVLEDSHNGVRAARAAGCAAIMVPDLLPPTEEMVAMCLAIAADLHEVRRLLLEVKQG